VGVVISMPGVWTARIRAIWLAQRRSVGRSYSAAICSCALKGTEGWMATLPFFFAVNRLLALLIE
jgi:hypothetical protein